MVLKVAPNAGGDMAAIAIVEAIEYATRHSATIKVLQKENWFH
jgi:hypothetical protein